MVTPRGTTRTGIRVHRGRFSQGCITLGPSNQGSQLENSLTRFVDRHLRQGRIILTIEEVDCCDYYY